jgi:hypothetical protein
MHILLIAIAILLVTLPFALVSERKAERRLALRKQQDEKTGSVLKDLYRENDIKIARFKKQQAAELKRLKVRRKK